MFNNIIIVTGKTLKALDVGPSLLLYIFFTIKSSIATSAFVPECYGTSSSVCSMFMSHLNRLLYILTT